jgi:23S rRNA pseudouridine2605 synthase
MRDHPGKEHSRRREAARLPAGARARPDHPKKPRNHKPAAREFQDARPAAPRPPISHKPAPGNGGDRKPSLAHGTQSDAAGTGARIAKVMARAGLCSRREAESWIGEGRVALNGMSLTNPAVNVQPGDSVTIDGEPLVQRARTRLFLFHKPRGLVTTARDPEGRPTVFNFLREHWPDGPRVVSIGRLDINTEGLLLLTNDGGLARILELPSTGWIRRYRVRANGVTDQAVLDKLRQGLTLDGVHYAGIEAKLDRVQGANSWLTIGLREGKNREIKRVLEHLGLYVNRLIRLSFGPFQLGDIAEGAIEEVRTRVLRDQLGPTLTEAAGADFLSPLEIENEAPEIPEAAPAHKPRTSGDPHRGNQPRQTRSPRAAKPPARDAQFEKKAVAKVKPAPRPRKHISALRAEEGNPHGPRKRVERRETADRAGRTVYVERLLSAGRAKESREKKPAKRPGKGKPFAARGGRGLGEESGRRTGWQGSKSSKGPRAPGPKGKAGRSSRIDSGRPAPRGQGPRRPREKS